MDFEAIMRTYSIPALLVILASLWGVYIQPRVKKMIDKMESRWDKNYNKDVESREKLYMEIFFSKIEGIKVQSETTNIAGDIKVIKEDVKALLKANGLKKK